MAVRSPYPRENVQGRETASRERDAVAAGYRGWTMAFFIFACVAVLAVPAFGWYSVAPGLFSVLMLVGRRSSQTALLAFKGLTWADVPTTVVYGFWLDWYEKAPDRHVDAVGAEIGTLPP